MTVREYIKKSLCGKVIVLKDGYTGIINDVTYIDDDCLGITIEGYGNVAFDVRVDVDEIKDPVINLEWLNMLKG